MDIKMNCYICENTWKKTCLWPMYGNLPCRNIIGNNENTNPKESQFSGTGSASTSLATYRLMSGLVARAHFTSLICSCWISRQVILYGWTQLPLL